MIVASIARAQGVQGVQCSSRNSVEEGVRRALHGGGGSMRGG